MRWSGSCAADADLEVEVIRRGISWANDLGVVRKIYREVLCHDEAYVKYCQQAAHTPEEDQKTGAARAAERHPEARSTRRAF